MAEYIESICRRCFHAYVCEQFNEHRDSNNEKCHFFNDHFVPAVDVAPVVHGMWDMNAEGDIIVYCNQCMIPQDMPTPYCPHCGARMDGE